LGPVEKAIRATYTVVPVTLYTLSKRALFTLSVIDNDGIVLLLGKNEASTPLAWEWLESIPPFLQGRGWVRVGGAHSVAGEPGTLDEHLKGYLTRDVARWLVVLLQGAGVVEVSVGPPLQIRLPRPARR
jgi:hypothetical protein